MGSILTNQSAQVALQTLNGINRNLGEVQDQISTGLKVGKAKDDAAIFAISQVVRSDIKGFESLSQSINVGSSSVAVASSGAKAIGEALNEIKGKIVSANEESFDKQTLQNEIESLAEQIGGIVSASQLNGLNLIDGSAGNVDFLSSLDRDSAGGVSTSAITVAAQDLSTTAGAAVAAAFDATQTGVNGAGSAFSAAIDESGGGTDNVAVAFDSAVAPTANSVYSLTIGDTSVSYTAKTGDDNLAVAYALRDEIQSSGANVTATVAPIADPTAADSVLTITNDDAAAGLTISGDVAATASGGLASLADIDVTVDAVAALDTIEGLISTATTTQAALGTAESRLEIQGDFLQKLTDSFKTGLGSLVDADLEEASARLQSLQVQQQLSTQALSIANQAPQSILSLFR